VSAAAARLPDGRLHLQHGPIDLLVQAWGPPAEIEAAYRQAWAAFPAVLPGLVAEIAHLRTPLPTSRPGGAIARAMHGAVCPFAGSLITPMAAVAGAVADHVLAALVRGRDVEKACVNNGGDIAFHLTPGQTLRAGLVTDLRAPAIDGVATLHAWRPFRGLATSGRACKGQGGRSFSFGIADAVTVLAMTAAQADAAATVIANAVDLPGHPAVLRRPAVDIDPGSDLGDRLVTWDLLAISPADATAALDAGRGVADTLLRAGLIGGAVLALQGHFAVVGPILAQLDPT
jgi:hypothetical protein